jgi:hypothetical protein
MKKNMFLPAILLSLLTVAYAHAESIVMKSTASGLEALSEADIEKHGQVVSDILQKYCWPMCQDSDLTPEEQHELLSPEGNEERFLEKKLNQTIPFSERNFDFAVVFVPTTLYELFCISELESPQDIPVFFPSKEVCRYPEDFDFDNFISEKKHDSLPFPSIYTEPVSTKTDRNRLLSLIKNFNQKFYQQEQKTGSKKFPILTSYRLFIEKLSQVPLFQGNKSLFLNHKTLSNHIAQNMPTLAPMILHIDNWTPLKTLLNYIACEYHAHRTNQGLICRGTRQNPNNKTIASTLESSLKQPGLFYPYSISFVSSLLVGFIKGLICRATGQNPNNKTIASTLENSLKQPGLFYPYSISFGSSLLAGFINGYQGGCVAFYLEQFDRIGYSLYIDKEKYCQNRINNLFFIQPLSSLANLTATDEHFHPRTIAAVKNASQQAEIKGLSCFNITGTCPKGTSDPAQVLTIERHPLDHESCFLKYFIDHYEIFHLPENSPLETDEQKKYAILEAQQMALSTTYARIKN